QSHTDRLGRGLCELMVASIGFGLVALSSCIGRMQTNQSTTHSGACCSNAQVVCAVKRSKSANLCALCQYGSHVSSLFFWWPTVYHCIGCAVHTSSAQKL